LIRVASRWSFGFVLLWCGGAEDEGFPIGVGHGDGGSGGGNDLLFAAKRLVEGFRSREAADTKMKFDVLTVVVEAAPGFVVAAKRAKGVFVIVWFELDVAVGAGAKRKRKEG